MRASDSEDGSTYSLSSSVLNYHFEVRRSCRRLPYIQFPSAAADGVVPRMDEDIMLIMRENT